MKLSFSVEQLGNPISNMLRFSLGLLRTCEGNLWETILNLYHTRRRSGWRCRPGCLKSLISSRRQHLQIISGFKIALDFSMN